MPIYDYQCASCGHQLEVIQKMSDTQLTRCPSCSKETLEKCVTAPSFRLGGSGWYETDFKSGQKKNISQADSEKKKTTSCKTSGSCKE